MDACDARNASLIPCVPDSVRSITTGGVHTKMGGAKTTLAIAQKKMSVSEKRTRKILSRGESKLQNTTEGITSFAESAQTLWFKRKRQPIRKRIGSRLTSSLVSAGLLGEGSYRRRSAARISERLSMVARGDSPLILHLPSTSAKAVSVLIARPKTISALDTLFRSFTTTQPAGPRILSFSAGSAIRNSITRFTPSSETLTGVA